MLGLLQRFSWGCSGRLGAAKEAAKGPTTASTRRTRSVPVPVLGSLRCILLVPSRIWDWDLGPPLPPLPPLPSDYSTKKTATVQRPPSQTAGNGALGIIRTPAPPFTLAPQTTWRACLLEDGIERSDQFEAFWNIRFPEGDTVAILRSFSRSAHVSNSGVDFLSRLFAKLLGHQSTSPPPPEASSLFM